jgi:hypothetical protein
LAHDLYRVTALRSICFVMRALPVFYRAAVSNV